MTGQWQTATPPSQLQREGGTRAPRRGQRQQPGHDPTHLYC